MTDDESTARGDPVVNHEKRINELPLATHERVLGADLTIHATWIYTEMHGIHNPSGFEEGVTIRAVDGDPYLDARDRKYLAAWARRNLFGKAPNDD